jgi:hypothetical protein
MNFYKKFWLGLAAAVALTAPGRAATVTATLDPAQISLGDATQLTVTVSGSQEQPTLPAIDGLEVQSVSQGTQYSIINGSITISSSVTYQITPQRAGTYTIPALKVGDAKSEPITLQVAGEGGAAAPGPTPSPAPGQAQMPGGSGPVVMPPNGGPPPEATPKLAPGKFGMIEVTLPKKEFYEGEMAPAMVRLFVPEDVRAQISDLPQFTSDGFTLNNLSTKPEQTQEEVQGRVYDVLTWHTAIMAVKPGEFSLKFSMPLTVIVRRQMPQMDDDNFSDFFRNAFAAMGGVRKEVTVTNEPEPLRVLPLPQANRPANFGGAVGTFEAEATASPDKVTAGDPVTLKLTISGRGNFDRVTSDLLPADANWKTYAPKSHFDAQDTAGFAGTKTFEQPIIPNNGAVTSVPPLSFSYFDPEKGDYATITTPPIPISVSGAPGAGPAPVMTPSASPSVATGNPPPSPVSLADDLRTNRFEAGTFVSTLEPVYLSPLFLAGQALPLLALLGGLAWWRRRQKLAHPERARLSAMQRAVRQQVAAMDAALRDEEAGAFFVHARNALQQRFGQEWKMRPEAITVADVEARLGEGSPNVRSIFEMADQASYSDLHFGEADLQKWREVVVSELVEANG